MIDGVLAKQNMTKIQEAAQENIEEINERIGEIEEQIDYQQCCDPKYSMSDEENELFFEMVRLLHSRSQLKKVVEDGLP